MFLEECVDEIVTENVRDEDWSITGGTCYVQPFHTIETTSPTLKPFLLGL